MSKPKTPRPEQPENGERPVEYADRLGRIHAESVTPAHKKKYGQYLTPVAVADFMASLAKPRRQDVRVLDPGAGAGILTCAVCEALATRRRPTQRIEAVCYETDKGLVPSLEASLSHLVAWLRPKGVALDFRIRCDDFVLDRGELLDDSKPLLRHSEQDKPFDVVIANPPYFKVRKDDRRARAVAHIVHGQPNVYAFFMAIAARLLDTGGELVFITPRSFASGPYFDAFRRYFFALVRPDRVHLFGSRTKAFSKDDILQEHVVLRGVRRDNWQRRASSGRMEITSSAGADDLTSPGRLKVPFCLALRLDGSGPVLRLPTSEWEGELVTAVDSWPGSLADHGMAISTGPVVPFRATEYLVPRPGGRRETVPLLWMQNVRPMSTTWPLPKCGKDQYFAVDERSRKLLVPDRTYVLLRRFSAKEDKQRLTAAPLVSAQLGSQMVALENHLNYVYRPDGSLTESEAYGLAALYNSTLLDSYFRILNGNTQVSATEMREMPLPPLEAIEELGRLVKSQDDLDGRVQNLLGVAPRPSR